VRESAAVRRAITVLKTRASHHQPDIREFTITPAGIVLGETFASEQSFG
jgi:circadian clock protein KaiC